MVLQVKDADGQGEFWDGVDGTRWGTRGLRQRQLLPPPCPSLLCVPPPGPVTLAQRRPVQAPHPPANHSQLGWGRNRAPGPGASSRPHPSITLTVLVSPHHTHTCTPGHHSSDGSAQKLLSKWMISNTQSFPKANLPKTMSFTQMADILVSILINTHTFTTFRFDSKSNLHGC